VEGVGCRLLGVGYGFSESGCRVLCSGVAPLRLNVPDLDAVLQFPSPFTLNLIPDSCYWLFPNLPIFLCTAGSRLRDPELLIGVTN